MLFLLIIMQMCDLWVAIFKLCLPTLHTDFYGAASFVSITVRFMISRNDEKLNKNLFFFSGGAWSKMTTIRSLKEAHSFSRIKLDKATTNYWHCTLFTFSLHGAHACDTWSASPAHEFFILMRWPLWCFPLDNNVESSNTSISLEVSKRVTLSKQWKIN